MAVKTRSIVHRNLDRPDEIRTPDKTTVAVVHVGSADVGRFELEPGWRWSECIKPIVKTESCQLDHLGYVISGRIHVVHDDGSEAEIGPGEAYRIAPGHDAWVVGNEPAVGLEFESAAGYEEWEKR
ncbi:MAG: cupin domain-containing protein [Actinomycetota bacterium]